MGAAAGNGIMASNARAPGAPPSRTYQPRYTNYGSPAYQAVRGAAQGLGATPQAMMYRPFTPQMPTYSRPSAPQFQQTPQGAVAQGALGGFFGRGPQPAYRIPMGGMQRPQVDPNLAIINQALAPQRAMYDTDGNTYTPPRYMEQSQRDAIMKNPGAYLEYAKFVQGGGDPAQFQRSAQPVSMMTAAQQQNLTKSQAAELGKILPAAAPVDSGGGG